MATLCVRMAKKPKNGPHHRVQREKLLYWANLAHSEVLGTSFLRFGPKIAILAGFMATLWVRMAKKPKLDPTIVFSTKKYCTGSI